MIQSKKIFRTHSGCWDYGSTDEPKYSKNPIFKYFFFMLNRTKTRFDASMVFNMIHLRIYGRKIISRYFQLVRISYQKLDVHGISRFSAVYIINNLNALRYNSVTMDTKSLFGLSFNRSDKDNANISTGFFRNLFIVSLTLTEQTNTYVGVFFVASVKRKPK
jgi:hypothetical protein